MTFLPTTTAPRISLDGLNTGQNQQHVADQDIRDMLISYAGANDAAPGARGKPLAKQDDGSRADRSRDQDSGKTGTSSRQQQIDDIDQKIASLDDALSKPRHPYAAAKLEDERQALLDERAQLVRQSPDHADAVLMADSEYAVDSDVQRQDFDALAAKAEARLDEKIAKLEQRLAEVKDAMDGASGAKKADLAEEHRQIQEDIKALQAERAEIRAMADLPDAPAAMAMAADVYNDESTLGDTHLKRLSDQELLDANIDPAMMEDEESGFHAAIYRNENTGEMVLVFEGTDMMSRTDWLTNGKQGLGLETTQYEMAQRLGQRFDRSFPDDNKMITGHSLGGGLAAYAGLSTGNEDIKVITFNASGLHDNTLASTNGQGGVTRADAEKTVTNFNLDGELLTTLQEGKPVSPVLSILSPPIGLANAALGVAMPDAVGRNHDIKAYDGAGDPVSLPERVLGHKSVGLHLGDALTTSVQAEMDRSMDRMREIAAPN